MTKKIKDILLRIGIGIGVIGVVWGTYLILNALHIL